MADATFDQRILRVARKHQRMAVGLVYRMRPDGLITAHPRRAPAPRFPWHGLLTIAALALGFKAFLLATLGADAYMTRLAILEAGSLAEQGGAWLMRPDRVTAALALAMDALAT